MTRPSTTKWKSKEKPQLSLQSRLRDLGFKLGRAEMHDCMESRKNMNPCVKHIERCLTSNTI